MANTYTRVQFSPYAIENRQHIDTITDIGNHQSFVVLDDLRTGNVISQSYATYEPDFWLLDGTYKFLPDENAHSGYVSTTMSTADGIYGGDDGNIPRVDVTFDAPITVDGITLRFSPHSGDYPDIVQVSYYIDSVHTGNISYYPDATEYYIDFYEENVTRFVIYLTQTNRAYRYGRLKGFDFGSVLTFEGESIKQANVIEETDPISIELRGNAFDVELYSADAEFSMLNPGGSYALLEQHQPLWVYESIDNVLTFIGQYFLDSWRNTSDKMIEFKCVDYVILMDQIPYNGGYWASPGIDVEDLLLDIMTDAGIPYELDVTLNGTKIIGWLPAGSVREALQQIAFTVGAAVDCSRSWVVQIYASRLASVETATGTITKAQKSQDQTLELLPICAGVEVTTHNIKASTESIELHDGSLTVGTHELFFSQPAHTLSITGATITESDVNYAIVEVAIEGDVVLSGKSYIDFKTIYRIDNPSVTSTIRPTLPFTEATLVRRGNVAAVAQRIYDYKQQRYEMRFKMYAPLVTPGQVVTVDTLYNKQITGVIESMETDLAAGMVSKLKIVGVEAV